MTVQICLLTGAGISAESGLKTFRGEDGLWEGEPVTEVATPEAFERNPQRVYRFYNMRKQQLQQVKPNAAHRAIASWQQRHPNSISLITQNVDNLHERAGSVELIHMHGELLKARCLHCHTVHEWHAELDATSQCPECGLNQCLRPDIVWFGEMPKAMEDIERKVLTCDLFIAVGTSALVYPAAGLSTLARQAGALTLEVNLQSTVASSAFDFRLTGSAGQTLPRFIETFEATEGLPLVSRMTRATAQTSR